MCCTNRNIKALSLTSLSPSLLIVLQISDCEVKKGGGEIIIPKSKDSHNTGSCNFLITMEYVKFNQKTGVS